MDNTNVFRMAFASVYPHYTAKAEKKGRTGWVAGKRRMEAGEAPGAIRSEYPKRGRMPTLLVAESPDRIDSRRAVRG